MTKHFKIPKKPQTFFQIINTGIEMGSFTFLKVLPISILYALASSGLSSPPHEEQYYGLIFFILYFVYVSLMMILYAAIIHKIDAMVHGKDDTFYNTIALASKRILSYWGLTLLYGIFIILGLFLLILPGIYIAVLLYFSMFALVLKNLGVMDSILESRKLVLGHWWRTFFLQFFIYFIYILIGYSISLIPAATISLFPQMNFNLLHIIFVFLITPFTTGILLAYYYDLQHRRAEKDHQDKTTTPKSPKEPKDTTVTRIV